ncbi:DUF2958 domain-containing protein [Burkholderia ambifaria]|uniref:DUF2958 domain-containing protein n=1 Tax=Burkholderia ambifaria TaxID=152480 RepID=UPI00187D4996|nr:DUF2958 domain-containing protein [Burkholderia ambifaria]MBR7929029.1 DUF2958 domain-containing protein [Burkholderia ambifaria]QQC05252.1 DUF2958 domain-containing protein [Burkholderia ambifaria]UZU03967.1 DUF2958 domain-containing protein [Burkholderia ambifaria]UZU10518.1 DUF2958 domain-containing protein [Burkholderia ambifaria]WDS14400.1 DUF2958 domain-containing protein [Burkholderia ambifaria]
MVRLFTARTLAGIIGPRKLRVRQDQYFRAVRPMLEYVQRAQENGSITDQVNLNGRSAQPVQPGRIVAISVLVETLQVLFRTLAPKRCDCVGNSHDLWRELRHGVQCCAPFSGGAAVAFRRFWQCTGANQS